MNHVEYQFQVAAIEHVVIGQRSSTVQAVLPTSQSEDTTTEYAGTTTQSEDTSTQGNFFH